MQGAERVGTLVEGWGVARGGEGGDTGRGVGCCKGRRGWGHW